jgi:ribonuclease HIII
LARNLVSQRGEEVLRSVAKTHFKTTEKVLGHPLSPLA